MVAARLDQILSGCALFRGMSQSERHEIHGLLEIKKYGPGETLLQEGQSLQVMCILLEGRCQVVKSKPGGGHYELAALEPCGVFGEMSFFHPAPHSASVHAVNEVEVGRLSREKYDMLLRVGSLAAYKLAFNTVSVLAERLRTTDAWVCELMEKSQETKHHEEWRDFQSKLYSGWQF